MKQTPHYLCVCGHLAYKHPRQPWNCMCGNPRPSGRSIIEPASGVWEEKDFKGLSKDLRDALIGKPKHKTTVSA